MLNGWRVRHRYVVFCTCTYVGRCNGTIWAITGWHMISCCSSVNYNWKKSCISTYLTGHMIIKFTFIYNARSVQSCIRFRQKKETPPCRCHFGQDLLLTTDTHQRSQPVARSSADRLRQKWAEHQRALRKAFHQLTLETSTNGAARWLSAEPQLTAG